MNPTDVSIWGVGTSRFGRQPGRRLEDLAWEAIGEALDNADVDATDIDAVLVGNVFGPSGVASRVARAAGLVDIPVHRVEAACASGTVAVHEAVQSIASGRYRRVLAVGIEQLSLVFEGPIVPEPSDSDGAIGLALPALYALQAERYLFDHSATVEDLAQVAVKNRAAGAGNDRAHRQSAVTLDEVLNSRPIAGQLTLLQCCPMSDGAGAAVIGGRRSVDTDVAVAGSTVIGGKGWPGESSEPWGVGSVRRAATAVEAATGRTLADAQVFEVHDAFTIGELTTVEALGLCAPGTAAELLREGEFGPGGRWVVNPGGGLLSRGHPLGATGLAQLAEVVWQLTGRAVGRQVEGAHLGVVETMGGGASGLDGNVAAVVLLDRDG